MNVNTWNNENETELRVFATSLVKITSDLLLVIRVLYGPSLLCLLKDVLYFDDRTNNKNIACNYLSYALIKPYF